MNAMKRFCSDIKKYFAYSVRAGKSELKSEVAFSHLSWLWWVLDPLLFMLVYSFVSYFVFGASEQYFSAFIFVGYTSFQFFQKTVKGSVRLVSQNKSIVKNVYIPKPVLMLTKLYVNLFTFAIGFMLVFVTMAIYRVKLTWHIIYFIPLVILLVLVSVSIGMIFMHFGVYVEDLLNVVDVVLKLVFYLSGVFYSLSKRIHIEWLNVLLLKCNPIAFIMDQMREALLYGGVFRWKVYLAWLLASFVLMTIGVNLVYKNENGYVKVI